MAAAREAGHHRSGAPWAPRPARQSAQAAVSHESAEARGSLPPAPPVRELQVAVAREAVPAPHPFGVRVAELLASQRPVPRAVRPRGRALVSLDAARQAVAPACRLPPPVWQRFAPV